MEIFQNYSTLIILLYVYSASSFRISANESACTPAGKPGMTQYVIGYGSLMSTASKNRTYPNTSENIPVEIKGYSRLWNCKGLSPSLSTTYLGSQADPEASFNGVIFALENGETGLRDFDKRESFYCRKEVPLKDIKLLYQNENAKSDETESQYWIYVTKPEYSEKPSFSYPIVQSYVDTWMEGCLEMEQKYNLTGFAENCVNSTKEWSAFWENDRLFPRRPFYHQPNAIKIDKIMQKLRPQEFSHSQILSKTSSATTLFSNPLCIFNILSAISVTSLLTFGKSF